MKCKQETQVKTFWGENICPCGTALDTMAKIDIATNHAVHIFSL
jgi:hypothetical protein